MNDFEWEIDGDNLVITSDDEVLEGVYSDGNLSIDLDGMTMTLGQEKKSMYLMNLERQSKIPRLKILMVSGTVL